MSEEDGVLRPCFSPEHSPPEQARIPGQTYEHECPACGAITTVTVQKVRW